MHFTKKSLVPALVSIIFLFSIAYAMRYSYVKLTDVLYLDSTDTTDTDNPYDIPMDVSGMFNERGYYNSNSVSYDENELISDFNGNLMYSFPMYKMKGPGDLYLDLSLNYNGSVNYRVVAAPVSQASQGTPLPVYNITAPGWIFSLNGMAVQMLNFETNYFTYPNPATGEAINNNVKLLASGYQLTDRQKTADAIDKDILLIMLGAVQL